MNLSYFISIMADERYAAGYRLPPKAESFPFASLPQNKANDCVKWYKT